MEKVRIKMVNKNKIFSILVLCGACCGTGLYGADTTINAPKTTTQGWAANGVDENNPTKVIFQGDGAINASPAANITKEGASTDPRFLSIDFQNEPSIDVPEMGTDKKAHMYSTAAAALILANGVNLEFTGNSNLYKLEAEESLANQKRAGIFARGNCIEFEGKTVVPSVTKFDQIFTLAVPTQVYAGSKISTGSNFSVVASAIGKANADGDVLLSGSIKYDIGNNSIFLATSSFDFVASTYNNYAYSGTAVIGASVGLASVSSNGNSRYEIGDNNVLNAYSLSSCSPSLPASRSGNTHVGTTVIGVSSGEAYNRSASMKGSNTCKIKNHNTLAAFSSSIPHCSGNLESCTRVGTAVIGASSGDADSSSTVSVMGDNRCEIGHHNILIASAYGSRATTTIIGASAGYADSTSNVSVSGNSVYEIGNYNTLSATSSSSSYSSGVVIGASAGSVGSSSSNISVSGSQEITINSGNVLSSLSTGTSTRNTIYSAAGVFGAACSGKFSNSNLLNGAASTARGMSINLNGSQTISALVGAFGNTTHGSEKVSVFGADDTDKREDVLDDGGAVTTPGDKYGWRVGVYNEGTEAATVNILGAKLAEQVVFTEKDGATTRDAGTATVVLNADQGSSYQDYARAFALGKDFQIYIGGKSRITTDPETKEVYVPGENESQFEIAGNGTNNVVNIFGAIAPAQYAVLNDNGRCSETKLVVDNNWTANVYGPVEGLEKFTIKNGAVVNAFDCIQKIGSLRLKGGTLHLKSGGKECLENALTSMTNGQDAPQLTFTHEIANGDENNKSGNYAVESITLADDYDADLNISSRFAKGGKLVLGDSEVLRFYIDTSTVTEDGLGGVSGMIKVDSGLNDALDFQQGSRIEIVDDRSEPLPEDPAEIETIPAKFVLLQADSMGVEEFLGDNDLDNVDKNDETGTWTLKDSVVDAALAELDAEDGGETGEAAQFRSLLRSIARALYANAGDEPVLLAEDGEPVSLEFDQDGGNVRMSLNGTVRRALRSEPSLPGVGSASAQINTAVVSMFRNAIGPRLAGARFRGDGAFIYGIGGHVHQSSIAGIGYGGDLYGVVAGADKLLNYKDGCVRLGAMIGYIYGDVDFRGSAIGKKQKSKQDNYLCALYGAYESINEKNLKTDLNLSCGFGYTKYRLNRVDQKDLGYNAKMKSNNFFLSAEFIKNLYAVQGIQFGLWLKADYNHIHQKAYSENGGAGAQSISKAKFDFLDTTVGINIEKEIQNSTSSDRSLRLYMKAGWNCQPMRSHSTIVAGVNGKDSVVSPHFGSRNSAVFTAGLRQKLNARWDLIGEWNGSFNKKHSNNLVTLGAGYTF